jgi:hypothetical protein
VVQPPDPDAVVVDFQAIRPDACVFLELNQTLADLKVKGLLLREGQSLRVWESWGDERHVAEGTVRGNDEWGWGVQIDPDLLRSFQP